MYNWGYNPLTSRGMSHQVVWMGSMKNLHYQQLVAPGGTLKMIEQGPLPEFVASKKNVGLELSQVMDLGKL